MVAHGHGHLTQLTETKEFFRCVEELEAVGLPFYEAPSHHCVALNGHLAKMASLHREDALLYC